MSTFSKRLKELRRKAKVSQQELSEIMGVSKSSINMYERGEREPGLERVKDFADYFDVQIDYILGKSDDARSVKDGKKYSRLIIELLESYRRSHGLTKQQMEEYLDWKNMYDDIETGRTLVSEDYLCIIENMLKVLDAPLPDIMTVPRNARPITRKKIPMLGNVACGEPIYATEEHDNFIDADEDVDADFCLTAKGDSMINARIFDGDILFVKSQQTVDNGEIAVVLIGDEATVKRVYYDKEANTITLVPENPTHKVMRYSGAEIDNIHIIGKVIVGQYKVE